MVVTGGLFGAAVVVTLGVGALPGVGFGLTGGGIASSSTSIFGEGVGAGGR